MGSFIVSGAGSGIGRAIAIKMAAESNEQRLILIGRNRAKLEETKSLLADPKRHAVISADVRNAEEIRLGLANALGGETSLAGVIANAGVGGDNIYGPQDRWREILDTNLTGTYLLVNEALPYLRKSSAEFKHIILISSILARLGVPRYSAYCASKAALLGLMRSWAIEFASEKILVNTVCPGWVKTEMAETGIALLAKATSRKYDEALAEQMELVPLKKMAEPEEVASLVAFLTAKEQRSMTGQAFDINNGALM